MTLKRRKADNPPLAWSPEEEKRLLKFLTDRTYSAKELQEIFPNRTLPAIRSKVRKLRIKHDLFGSSYREEKESFTVSVAEKVSPKVVFDAYAGAGHQTFKWIQIADTIYASEKMSGKLDQFEKSAFDNGFQKNDTGDCLWKLYTRESKSIYFFEGDAIDAAADLKVNQVAIDLIDLDTCGSTIPSLPTFLLLLKPKHLVITHGEFHSMRFQREDVIRRLFSHRDIRNGAIPSTIDEMCDELDIAVKIAALRAHNETMDSFWLNLVDQTWLGTKTHGMLRRHYKVERPVATSDCINEISG